MAFTDQIAVLQAAIYAQFGVAALWTPSAGAATTVTLLPDQADKLAMIGGLGKNNLSRNVFRCRVSQMATPAVKDVIQLLDATGAPLGRALIIIDPPSRDDTRQTEWTLVCA